MKIQLFAVILLLFLTQCLTKKDVQVFVQSPQELKNFYQNLNMDLTLANYGYVPYGKSLIGNVHVANPIDACSPLKPMQINQGNDPAPILLVKRGNCTFVTKSHYAQLIGAKLVLIWDTTNENEERIIVVDDGFGYDINIPTVMISNSDALQLMKYVRSDDQQIANNVALQFKFPVPQVNQTVTYQLWMSSADVKSFEFLRQFKVFQERLEQHHLVKFEPHYALWFCSYCRIEGYRITNPNCLSGGRYCAPDPDQGGPLVGKNVVMEDLRQICIHRNEPKNWWGYMLRYEEQCVNKTVSNLDLCSEKVQQDLGIDVSKTQNCIRSSFGNSADYDRTDNSILAEERKLFMGQGIQIWPSVVINNMTYRGNLLPSKGVYDAICSSFYIAPEICTQPIVIDSNSGMSTGSIIAIIVCVLVIFMIFVLLAYRRMIRREMNKELQLQVNTAISQYFALSDGQQKVQKI